jgi:hypothetical protein
MSFLTAMNYYWCRCYQRLTIAGVVVTDDKVIVGVMESMKIRNMADGVNDNGDNLLPVTTTLVNSLSPVSLTPAINTKLRVSLS